MQNATLVSARYRVLVGFRGKRFGVSVYRCVVNGEVNTTADVEEVDPTGRTRGSPYSVSIGTEAFTRRDGKSAGALKRVLRSIAVHAVKGFYYDHYMKGEQTARWSQSADELAQAMS